MTYEQIIDKLEKKVYYPVYFLQGEEPYFIDEISGWIEDNLLNETEKEFNQTIVYGRDIDIPTLVSYVKRYPMMANYQVVIVKEAQDLNKLEDLQSYLENPLDTTILVINYKYKKLDQRTKFGKTLKKSSKTVFFDSPKLYENKIPTWIAQYLAAKDFKITPKACALIADSLGTDLSKIANELNKLIINLPEKTEINENHIEENIGISKDFNVFELQNALGKKDVVKANRIINYFGANPKSTPLPMLTAVLFQYFTKILLLHSTRDKSQNSVASLLGVHPFFVNDYTQAARAYPIKKAKRIISFIRDYDMKSKGVNNANATDGELMKELLFKILHV